MTEKKDRTDYSSDRVLVAFADVSRLLAGATVGEADLRAVVSMDSAVTAKLLKMANSSLYNLTGKA